IEKQSYDKYVNNFKRFFKNGISDISKRTISSIDEDELEIFIKKTIKHYKLKPKGYRDMKCLIREMFKTARKNKQTDIIISFFLEDIDINKKLYGKSFKEESECVFTDEEIEKLWDYVFSLKEPEVRDFGVLLGFFTGLRASEISALTASAINDKVIHVCRTEKRYKDEEGHYLYDVDNSGKTEASIRNIVLVPESRILLERIKEINPNGEFLFEKPNGERFIGKAFTNKLKSLCKAVGIKERSFHKTRATFITKMINAGVEETVILNQAGHTKIETSREHYEYNNRSLDNAAVQLERALSFKNFNH
ncbi:MAG: site-specific integrase, partial [Eubacterium sp.]|nr:site-specific integrase [Eubacterium sp.]